MNVRRPPLIPRIVLRALMPDAFREPFLGDLHEGFMRRQGSSANLWYWQQAIRGVVPLVRWHVRYGAALRRVLSAWAAVVSMGITIAVLSVSASSFLPVHYVDQMKHIGRGVPAADGWMTLFAVTFFALCLFISCGLGARVYSALAGGRWPAVLALIALWVGPAVRSWAEESTGAEVLWIQVVLVLSCVAGISIGIFAFRRKVVRPVLGVPLGGHASG